MSRLSTEELTNTLRDTYGDHITAGDVRAYCAMNGMSYPCLLYTSPSPRDVEESRMPSSA